MTSARRLLISTELGAYLRTLHPEIKRKIRAALDTGVAGPLSGKPLRGPLLGLWSTRVGRLRIIYRQSGEMIQIVAREGQSTKKRSD